IEAISVGTSPSGWRAQEAFRGRAHLAFGLHPWQAGSLEALPDHLRGAVAVGEIGLDRHRGHPEQEQAFRDQLDLARQLDLPVILHLVKSDGRALELFQQDGLPKAGGVIHSFSSSPEMVVDYLKLGLYIGFAGNLLRHDKAARAAREVPLERLLVETDAPSQLAEPAQVGRVVERLAELFGLSPTEIAEKTDQNARRLFRLKAPACSDAN
ncbi:MAG: TatD family hydrolase, partial [Candidatus Eremiobacteraeota bacterium]|nr:TatD family hydrolase [Candidatus Eremiobacteraeota bacterium]